MITDRDCDAPRELLLMADAHLWSVSGAGAGALPERNCDQSRVETFMMLQYFDRKQAIPVSQMNVARQIPTLSYKDDAFTFIYMARSRSKDGEKDIRISLLMLAGSKKILILILKVLMTC